MVDNCISITKETEQTMKSSFEQRVRIKLQNNIYSTCILILGKKSRCSVEILSYE